MMVDPLSIPGLTEAKDYLAIANGCLIRQSVKIPPPDTAVYLNGSPLFTKKSISVIIGKAKAGKTTLLAYLLADALFDRKILWFDTEQGLYYASLTQSYLLKCAGKTTSENLLFYDLKQFNPTDRLKIISSVLEQENADLLVIDGLRDIAFDINSSEEAVLRVGDLMRWSDQYNCHVTTVLHQNKADNNARGHLGTEIINKCELAISVTKAEDYPGVSTIVAEYSRALPFDSFSLERDDHGVPFLANIQPEKKNRPSRKSKLLPVDIQPDTHREVVEKVFSIECALKYDDVVKNIKCYFDKHGTEMGINKAGDFCTYYLLEGLIIKNDNLKGYAKYQSGLTEKAL